MKFPHALLRRLLFLAIPGFLVPQAAVRARSPDVESYRKFALTRQGDVERGKSLFNDPESICGSCHSVNGSASKAGPNLSAADDAFGRRDLVDAVLTPFATTAPGYGAVFVKTKAGDTCQGVLKQKTGTELELMGADGKLVSIPVSDIQEQSGLSARLPHRLRKTSPPASENRQRGRGPLPRLVSFCEGAAGNLYAVGYEGMVYKLDFTNALFE